MVTKKQSTEMLDYIVSNLEGSGEHIVPMQKEIVRGIQSNYILVGEKGIVLLVDKYYPNNSYETLHSVARSKRDNIATVFYKDGKSFFRSAAEDNNFKKSKGLSLKDYSNDELNKMILLRPEEISIVNKLRWVQYYQPQSDSLGKAIESFSFEPVTFDYSHIDSDRFRPSNTESKRLYVWGKRSHNNGSLDLSEKYLIPRKNIEIKPEVKEEPKVEVKQVVSPINYSSEPTFSVLERQSMDECRKELDSKVNE